MIRLPQLRGGWLLPIFSAMPRRRTPDDADLIARFPGAYGSWVSMLARCRTHPDYAGRGISVCEAWRWSFAYFVDDMGERPAGCSIEREDNEGDYEPGNCVWGTAKDQSANRRNTAPLVERVSARHKPARPDRERVNYQRIASLAVVRGSYLIGHNGERVEPRYWALVV